MLTVTTYKPGDHHGNYVGLRHPKQPSAPHWTDEAAAAALEAGDVREAIRLMRIKLASNHGTDS